MDIELSSLSSKTSQECTNGPLELTKRTSKAEGRILRARRYRKRFEEQRPPKRLFTPEIKRYLKSWLIRRRENPYPSREEKKDLADQTGLTYIQICNWFANWRRKLKNTGKEFDSSSWTTLIKSYNGQVEGNVEQFSISSDDSIWHEVESPAVLKKMDPSCMKPQDHSYTNEQCFQISSTSDIAYRERSSSKDYADRNGNYSRETGDGLADGYGAPLLLRRWLQSAACFQPRHDNYIPNNAFNLKTYKLYEDIIHGREEIDAAEALTFLSRAARNRLSR